MMYKHGGRCPICDKGLLKNRIFNERFEYKGNSITIPDYETFKCSYCEEEIANELSEEHKKYIREFIEKTKLELLNEN